MIPEIVGTMFCLRHQGHLTNFAWLNLWTFEQELYQISHDFKFTVLFSYNFNSITFTCMNASLLYSICLLFISLNKYYLCQYYKYSMRSAEILFKYFNDNQTFWYITKLLTFAKLSLTSGYLSQIYPGSQKSQNL